MWKIEYVTPIAKTKIVTKYSQIRKIASTSDYSKLTENFLKDMIIEDIGEKLDMSQYGGRKGVGTEHLIVGFIDRVLKLLDSTRERTAVLAATADWASAFDRSCPTAVSLKMIGLGIRTSIIPLLISYMSDRKMIVKYKDSLSSPKGLTGGAGQGTILAGLQYLVASNDCALDSVTSEDRFRFYDDIEILEFLVLTERLIHYDFIQHVASDIPVDHLYLPPNSFNMQNHLNDISKWTDDNHMLLNEEKSKYIIFTRSKQEFSTRLSLNNTPLERMKIFKLLGLWLQEDMGWDTNTREMCKKAYSRVSVLCKLKYAGISIEDLIIIYTLFIRSLTEYCSVAFHSALTESQCHKIEAIQSTCLQVILADNYVSYLFYLMYIYARLRPKYVH